MTALESPHFVWNNKGKDEEYSLTRFRERVWFEAGFREALDDCVTDDYHAFLKF